MVSLLALVAASIAATSSGGPIRFEVDLSLTAIKAVELTSLPSTRASMAPLGYDPYTGRMATPRGYTLPKIAGKPTWTRIGLNDSLEFFVAVLGKSTDESKQWDRLWIDWNRDKAFADDELVMPEEAGHKMQDDNVVCFGPVNVPPGQGRPAKLCFLLEGGYALRVLPTEIREGRLQLNGKAYRIGLVDTNFDGIYNTRGMQWDAVDAVLIDQNGDGRFFMKNQSSPFNSEAMPIQTYAQLPDGNFYQMDIPANGERIAFSRDPAKEGTIVGLRPGSSLMLYRIVKKATTDPTERISIDGMAMGSSEMLNATVGKSGLRLPAGKYQISGAAFSVPSAKGGKPWSYTVSQGGKGKGLDIKPGKTARFESGGPFKVALRASPQGANYSFDITLRDKAGNPVTGVTKSDGQMPAEPVLTIRNASGKTIKTQKFHYG